MNADRYHRECGCTVEIQPTGILVSACGETEHAYKEAIIIVPCHDHDDHEHGVFRKEEQ